MFFNPLDQSGERGPARISTPRELAVLVPLIVAIVWIGLYPQPILRRTEAAAQRYVETIRPYIPAPRTPVTAPRRRRPTDAARPPDPDRRDAGAAAGRAAQRAGRWSCCWWWPGATAPRATAGSPAGSRVVGVIGAAGGDALALAVAAPGAAACRTWSPRRVPLRERAAGPRSSPDPPASCRSGTSGSSGCSRPSTTCWCSSPPSACMLMSRRPTSSCCSSASRSCRSRCTCWPGFDRFRRSSAEAALKYFLIGAFASGFLLYGIALVYGATGQTNYILIGAAAHHRYRRSWRRIGLALLLVGLRLQGGGGAVPHVGARRLRRVRPRRSPASWRPA